MVDKDKNPFLFYDMGMIPILGLGNDSTQLRNTRHNVGMQAVDAYAEKEGVVFFDEKLVYASVGTDGELVLVLPHLFMNESGKCAQKVAQHYKTLPVVIYDDIDIPLGAVKCSFGRGAGGHNGVQSVIDYLGTKDFLRIRIGIRPVHEELAHAILPPKGFEQFVLKPFAPFEETLRDESIQKAIDIMSALKTMSYEEIMNRWN